ncbi:MAG: glycosyltransferase family 2 protein [Limisphaerales bacterium]
MPYDISIIVPVYNEAANVLPLAREVADALRQEKRSFELVFVDDASHDGTWEKIQEAHRLDRRVRGLRHARNSGQSAALWTGLQATESQIIATLDGDLQNDPADLPRLLAELGHVDFVCGIRLKRRDSFVRRISSGVARWARKLALNVDFRDSACSLRAFKRSALSGILPFHGFHRFLPILVQGGGTATKEIAISHRPRVAGVSKYGIWNRLGRGIVDLLAMAWYQRRRLRPVAFTQLPPDAK